MSKKIISIFIIIILLFSGCKQKEKIIIQELKHVMDAEELENIIFRDEVELRTIKMNRINLEVEMNDEKYSSNGTIGIIRDSIIVISLVPILGYEMARIYCTKDSLFFIDRQKKNVYKTRIDEQLREDSIRIDYHLLQCILMNQAVIYDKGEKNAVFRKNVINEGNYYYYTIEQLKDKKIAYIQTIKIKENSWLNESIVVTDYLLQKKIDIKYNDFQEIEQFILPKMIDVIIIENQNTIKVQLRIGNIEINEKINAEMNIPQNYNQIKI